MKIIENYSLKHLNTFGIEARAQYFVQLNTTREIIDFVENKKHTEHPNFILNGGSNTLFSGDYDGLVIKVNNVGWEVVKQDQGHIFIKVSAGENWDNFVSLTIGSGFAGLENLSMIPGNVGAAPIQNIGAYGVEQKDHFHSLEAINIETGEILTFDAKDCKFGYRSSIFKTELRGQYIVLSVIYKLNKKPALNVEYGAIRRELENLGAGKIITLKNVSQAIRNIRGSKLPDPEKIGNAGSFFKNPVVSKGKYFALLEKYPAITAFPDENGKYKIAAGWMIDHLGWKGEKRGDAGVCETQALVLVNYGKATGSEIVALANEIQQSVNDAFGIILEPEVNIV